VSWDGAWTNQLLNLLILSAAQSGFSGLFVYSPAPGPGNLVASFSAVAGTDRPFGNTYPAGLVIGVNTSTQLQLISSSGAGILNFLANTTSITNGFLLGEGGIPSTIVLQGPFDGTAGWNDYIQQLIASSNGSSTPAFLQLGYVDANGVTHGYLVESPAGLVISAGSILAVTPGTGTSPANPATQETWHTMPAFNANFSHGSPVPAYKLNPDNTVSLTGQVNVTAGTTSGTVVTLPTAAYFPQSVKTFPIPISAGTPAAAGSARVNIGTIGNIVLAGGPTVNAYIFSLDGMRYPLDY
jgi:hypothetical protein